VLTTVDFDDDPLIEANEVKNKALKRDLPTEFEERQPSIAEQPPHRGFCIGGLATHLPCENAEALGCR